MTKNRPQRAAIATTASKTNKKAPIVQTVLIHEGRNTCSYLTEIEMHTFASKFFSCVKF